MKATDLYTAHDSSRYTGPGSGAHEQARNLLLFYCTPTRLVFMSEEKKTTNTLPASQVWNIKNELRKLNISRICGTECCSRGRDFSARQRVVQLTIDCTTRVLCSDQCMRSTVSCPAYFSRMQTPPLKTMEATTNIPITHGGSPTNVYIQQSTNTTGKTAGAITRRVEVFVQKR